jgi:predicted RNase H-like HicB family nuclease
VRLRLTVTIERDEDAYYVATVQQSRGRHTQSRSLRVLMKRIKEGAELCLGFNAKGHADLLADCRSGGVVP